MADLFSETIDLSLPARFSIWGRVGGNLIRQLAEGRRQKTLIVTPDAKGFKGESSAGLDITFVRRGASVHKGSKNAVRIDSATSALELQRSLHRETAHWLLPRFEISSKVSLDEFDKRRSTIRSSWVNSLTLREERYSDEGELLEAGFRPPQIGAIHAAMAHWVVSDAPATLVMPTGTGKTETMLALLVLEKIDKLLVVVPSDQLRSQIAAKFETFGVLKHAGLLIESALFPIVTTLKKAPTSISEVDEIFGRSQVVVTTMQAISRLSTELKDRVVEHVTHFFVDEAHHIGASTWKSLKTHFVRKNRKILQFTATPYRSDSKRVDGKFIFVYPLRRAQEQQLFRPVHYVPIYEAVEEQADIAIIDQVGEALDADLANGFDHLAMARTSDISRATHLLALYKAHLPRYRAEVVHSKLPPSERMAVLDRLRTGATRIIICVNMLGEGFDLPKLKIAGLHDRHRSEAVTLQFIGRFTRAQKGLGDATVIAGVSLDDPREWLNALYREDADWNVLLHTGTSERIEHQRKREELYTGLDRDFDHVPVETVTPKLNAYVFRLPDGQWSPTAMEELEKPSINIVEGPIINDELAFVMAITRHEDRLRWSRVHNPVDVLYNLIMVYLDREQGLLYVHSFPEDGLVHEVARLISNSAAMPLRGESVFRVLHGYRRVMLTNLGVKETQVKPIRFQLSTGIDITPQLEATVDNQTRIKTNLFGHGYVDEPVYTGDEVYENQSAKRSIGCSIKGKIWSQEGAIYPGDWIDWCKTIGPKIADESINTDAVLRNVLRPKRLEKFPSGKVPISIDWPEGLLTSDEEKVMLSFDEAKFPLSECEIDISVYDEERPFRFHIRTTNLSASYSLDIRDGLAIFRKLGGMEVLVTRGKRTRDIIELFREDPPTIRFTDGDMLVGADLSAAPGDDRQLFDLSRMIALDWMGVDLTKESQGSAKISDTIQHKTIQILKNADPPYDLIFDGDTSGEVADVVAIRRQGRFLDVELYHCKFSSKPEKGARVADLYELCGQAMKAVRWADPRSKFLQRLRHQEERRLKSSKVSRFELGHRAMLDEWLSNRREYVTRFSMTLVQPGYSKAKADIKHLPILGAVQSYLTQTYNIGLTFWSNS